MTSRVMHLDFACTREHLFQYRQLEYINVPSGLTRGESVTVVTRDGEERDGVVDMDQEFVPCHATNSHQLRHFYVVKFNQD